MQMRNETYILHHAHGLLSLADKFILRLLNLRTRLLAQVVQITAGSRLPPGLDRVEHEPGILHVLARLGRKHQVGVQGGVPASQEARLDLSVLRQTGLAHLLGSERVLLERGRQRVLTGMDLCQGLRSSQRGARDGMVKRLGLRFGRWRSDQGRLGLGRRRSLRQKLDLFADSAA